MPDKRVTSRELFKWPELFTWPEWIALEKRLGVTERATRTVTITAEIGQAAVVTVEYLPTDQNAGDE